MAHLKVQVTNNWTGKLRVTYYDLLDQQQQEDVINAGAASAFDDPGFPGHPARPFWEDPPNGPPKRWPVDATNLPVRGRGRAVAHAALQWPPLYTYLRIVARSVPDGQTATAVLRVPTDGTSVQLEVRRNPNGRPVFVWP